MDYVNDVLLQIYNGTWHCIAGVISLNNFGFLQKEQKTLQRDKLFKKILYCVALNGLAFGSTVYCFHWFLLPFIQNVADFIGGKDLAEGVWRFLYPVLTSLFNALWLAPMLLLSRIVNFLWFQDVADLAYEISLLKDSMKSKKVKLSFTTFVADAICSFAIQSLFLFQAGVVKHFPIPYVGDVLNIFHMSLLYSLYAFEYKWINFGWPLHKRLAFIDCNWPYFFGFGLPLAIATVKVDSYIYSICAFSICFPLYIISGINSKPVLCKFNCRLHIFVPVLYCWNFCTKSATQKSVIKRN